MEVRRHVVGGECNGSFQQSHGLGRVAIAGEKPSIQRELIGIKAGIHQGIEPGIRWISEGAGGLGRAADRPRPLGLAGTFVERDN